MRFDEQSAIARCATVPRHHKEESLKKSLFGIGIAIFNTGESTPMNPVYLHSASKLSLPPFSSVPQTYDAIVLGAGFTGLTAAWELQRAGKTVAVMDAGEVAGGESALSTAQLTELLDIRYHQLVDDLGVESATAVAHSSRVAMDWVEQRIQDEHIDCNAARVPAYLYCGDVAHEDEILKECAAASKCGVSARLTTEIPSAFRAQKAMAVENQLQIHPRRYLQGLAKKLLAQGCKIFEMSKASKITDGEPCVVEFADGSVARAKDVVVATHTPICNTVFLHTKIAAYRTYVLGATLNEPLPAVGMYFDTEDPYHYIRTEQVDGKDVLLVGGEDHKTGDVEHTELYFQRLEKFLRGHFDVDTIAYRWSGQVIETVDGLPYIGLNSASKHLYVATGFSGNGTTFGTLGGMIVADLIQGRTNPFADLYRATRVRPIASAATFVAENANVVKHFLADWLASTDVKSFESIPAGEGRVLTLHGKKCAVYRTPHGGFAALSAVCPHLGCIVHWNQAESSWDCPCHGSRFDLSGRVLNGPSTQDLQPVLAPHIERVEHAEKS